MKGCTISNTNLDPKLNKIIDRVCTSLKGNMQMSRQLAGILTSDGFIQYVKNNYADALNKGNANFDISEMSYNDLDKFNQNKIVTALKEYYQSKYKDVSITAVKLSEDRLNGFKSGRSKIVARDYCGSLIINSFIEELNKPADKRKHINQIIWEVSNKIENDFYTNYIEPLVKDIIGSVGKYSEEVTNLANKYNDSTNELKFVQMIYNHLNTAIKADTKNIAKYNTLISTTKDEKRKKVLQDKLDEIQKRNDKNKIELEGIENSIEEKLLNKYISAQLLANAKFDLADTTRVSQIKEFANLVSQCKHNPDEWFFQVRYCKKVTNVSKLFSKVTDLGVAFDEMNENDDIVSQKYNGETVDETAKTWEDNLYSNFTDTVDGKLKMYLSTIPRLSAPYTEGAEQFENTDNDLGVKTTMDFSYVVNQIYSFGNFNSPDELIQSLESKFNSTKALYGLGKIVADMKSDFVFANLIYTTFAKPIANKVIVTTGNEGNKIGIKIDYSNNTAFPIIDLSFKLMNHTRNIIRSENLKTYIDKIDKLKKYAKNINVKDTRDIIFNTLFDIIHDCFPNIQKDNIDKIFETDAYKNDIDIILDSIDNILKGVIDIQKGINEDISRIEARYKKDYDDYRLALIRYYQNNMIGDRPQPPIKEKVSVSGYDLSPVINRNIIKLANTLIKYSESRAKLNTKNAAGNTASDVIKQCYVTRFFEQLNGKTEKDQLAGLKSLIDYFTQGTENNGTNQYSNTPILFGLKNIDGTPVAGAEGLFKKTVEGYVPTDHAKELLSYSLFDGIKNDTSNTGQLYDQSRKTDWQITLYQAYLNSLEDFVDGTKTTNVNGQSTAVYSMRIPSDAPKIFFIKAPRYSDEKINGVSKVRLAIYNHVMNELQMFVNGLKNVFVDNGNGVYTLTTNKRNLFGRAYYDEKIAEKLEEAGRAKGKKENEVDYTKAFFDGKRLTGRMFRFLRLFELDNYNAEENIMNMLSLYGQADSLITVVDGKVCLNLNETSKKFIGTDINGNLSFKPTLELSNAIYNIVDEWCDAYTKEAILKSEEFIETYSNIAGKDNFNNMQFKEFLLNYVNMNITYDDLFEGDFKYYKNSRDFLKRTKEAQAGGSVYADGTVLSNDTNIIDNEKQSITIKTKLNHREPLIINGKQLYTRNGFRAITIYNTVGAADNAEAMAKQLYELFRKEGYTKEAAKKRADKIANGYFENTKKNDAQSYITFQEFIRRKVADGTYDQYEDIISQILDCKDAKDKLNHAEEKIKNYENFDDIKRILTTNENDLEDEKEKESYREKLAEIMQDEKVANYAKAREKFENTVNAINLDDINARIQVQKNFYYDKIFDAATGDYYSRQIKNAEFVIIPELLPEDSDLIRIAKFMDDHNIDQLNTAETSKAAKKNIFTIFDNDGKLIDNFEDNYTDEYLENYYYKYLYKQQDVPQHLVDERNKAGIQITKKVIDNLMLYKNSDDPEKRKLYQKSVEYMNAYTANIREDFYNLLDDMGWTFDENGSLVNKNYSTTDVYGNKLDDASQKLVREKLNFDEFYALAREQAANLGMDSKFIECLTPANFGDPRVPNFLTFSSAKLESIAQSIFNSRITRQTFPGWHAAQITGIGYSKKLKWDPKTGVMEVRIPRWSKLIPKGKNAKENEDILRQIQNEGLDIQIGYRIPSEGKQSIAVLRVVGFVEDCLGSTIVVPDEWVTQTGSDFDVDSIYGICWEMYKTVDKNGKISLHKIKSDEESTTDEQLYINYVNGKLNKPIKQTSISKAVKSAKELIYEKYADALNEEKHFREKGVIKELRNEQQDAFKALPKEIRKEIGKYKLQKVTNAEGKTYNDWIDFFEHKLIAANELLNTIDEEHKQILENYIDITNKILKAEKVVHGMTDTLTEFREAKKQGIDSAIAELKEEYFKKTQNAAKELGLMSFEEFKELPFVEKLSRKARNNYILDRIIDIMKSPYTKEEQYGRSQFEDITDAKEYVQYISGDSTKTYSPYDLMSQIEYQDDVMSGAALKARSVNADTLVSKNNRIRNKLNKRYSVSFILPTGKCVYTKEDGTIYVPKTGETHAAPIYDDNEIAKSYGDDVTPVINKNNDDYIGVFDSSSEGANMAMLYNGKQRSDVKSLSTFEAIINGERTATTKYGNNEKSLKYWQNLKKGDKVRVFNSNKTRAIIIRITKPAQNVTNIKSDKELDDWSKKEGWSVDYLKEHMQTAEWKSGAWQIEFEYVGEEKNANFDKLDNNGNTFTNEEVSKAAKYIEDTVGYEEFSDTYWTLKSDSKGLTDKEISQLFEKKNSRPNRPIVAVASEHTDPVWHAAHIKKIVEDELAKPVGERNFHALYFITKHDGLPLKELLQLGMPKVIHFSITGLGGTQWEPGVMKADDLLDRIEEYINNGLLKPRETTIRIDPIIPGITTPAMIRHIVERSMKMGIRDFKFSVMDSYGYTENTAKDRKIIDNMRKNGYKWEENYDIDKSNNKIAFNAKKDKIIKIFNYIDNLGEEFSINFNTCAETPVGVSFKHIRSMGCLSAAAVNAMTGSNVEDEKGIQRNNCSCYGGKFDLLRYDDKCASSCTYCYASHGNDRHVEYYDENGKLKDNIFTRAIDNHFRTRKNTVRIEKGKYRNPDRFVLHSGGARGADSMWGEIAEKYGIPHIAGRQNHYIYGDDMGDTPYGNITLTDEQYEEGRHAIAVGAKEGYGYQFNAFKDHRIARNWFQVANADAVYAIGFGIMPGQPISTKPNETRITRMQTVRGGTMYAVNAAIIMNKPVYLFDLNSQHWFKCENKVWTKLDSAPILTENFAGIGSRECANAKYRAVAEQAINDCFTRTFEEKVSDKEDNSPALIHGNYENTDGIKFNARSIGFSNTDKNVVGDYVTSSTAETTAHHLDAVKEGSLKNVNEFTFDAYKLMSMTGLDHWAIVSIMYNPVITKLVAANNTINSIYGKFEESPFKLVLEQICRAVNIGPLTSDATFFDVWNAITNDKRIAKHFLVNYNLDISTISPYKLYKADIPINIEHCIERIKVARQNQTTTPHSIEDAIFDISLLMSFNRLLNTGKRVMNIGTDLNTDKFGAKISMHETAKTVDQIESHRDDDTFEIPMVDLVYPKDDNGQIDEKKSKYPSIAACYKYATLSSLDINRRLFTTENRSFYTAFADLENNIGHRLTEEEYKQVKTFAIHYLLYRNAKKLCTPLTLTDKKHLIKYQEDADFQTQDYYDDEISRLFGYGYDDFKDIEIKDIYNPTADEIAKFNKYSPAQKVLYIQKHFFDSSGIFDYLNVQLSNIFDTNIRSGLSRNFINFDESANSIEDLLYLFNNSFQNHNPLVKLAALDLIKYAFIAEGYKFKYGYISKIVTNNSLYDSVKNGGLDIITDFKREINDLPVKVSSIEFASAVIRHNPNLLHIQKLPNLPEVQTSIDPSTGELTQQYKTTNTAVTFIQSEMDGAVTIDTNTDEGTKLYNKLHLYNKAFIRIQHPSTSEINIYRVIRKNQYYHLMPLNTLASEEISDYSYNEKRNKFYSQEYYLSIFQGQVNEPHSVPAQKIKYDHTSNTFTNNCYVLSDMIHSFNEKEKIAGKKVISAIKDAYARSKIVGEFTPTVVMISNYELRNKTDVGLPSVQILDTIDGVDNPVQIQITRLTRDSLQRFIDSYNQGRSDYAEQFVNQSKNTSLPDILKTAYLIEDVTPKDTPKTFNAETELLEEQISDDMARGLNLKPSVTDLVDVVSKEIISEISFVDLKHGNKATQKFLHSLEQHKINRHNRQSLKNNRLTLYRMANAYYRNAANNLISMLNGFDVIDNGELKTFKLGDPALYEFLAKNDTYRDQIIKIILDSVTFGDRIKDIFDLVDYSEDEEVGKLINEIIHNINMVRNNTEVNNAMKYMINIYFRKYSTNPMIVDGLLNLRDTFGDTDKMWSLVSNTTEIANSEVQVFLKQIYTMLDKAEMFDAERNLKEYKEEVAKIKAMPESIDESKVFNKKEGRLYQAFNKRFLDDYEQIRQEYNEAYNNRMIDEAHFGKYLDAKYKRDKFMYEHTEQKILPQYYERKLAIEKEAMDKIKDIYVKYKYLSAQKWEVDIINNPTEENQNLLNRLSTEMFSLRSSVDETGELKLGVEAAEAAYLQNYVTQMAEFNEEYFNSQEYDGFQEEYEKYRKYIDRYNARHPELSLEEKLQDDMYNTAYKWIKSNGYVTFTGEAGEKLKKAYKALTGNTTSVSSQIRLQAKSLGIVDKAGIIDARKYTPEQIAQLKQSQENELTYLYDNGYGESMLIKDIPDQDFILTEKVKGDTDKTEIIRKMFNDPEQKTQIIKEINNILKKYINDAGRIDYQLMVTTKDNESELERLGDLYVELYNLRSELYKKHIKADDSEAMFTEEIDYDRCTTAKAIIDTVTINKNSIKTALLAKILEFRLSDGSKIVNPYLFGYKKIKEEFVDKEKSAARKYIKDNVEYVATEYYFEAYKEAAAKGQEYFRNWYNQNHVYNPYTHRYEPLSVWTTMQAKAESELAGAVHYMPSFDNKENFVKEEYINNAENRKRIGLSGEGFKEFGRNYKRGDSKYDNPITLNRKEEALRQLIENTLNKYATTYQGKRFVGEGFLPRERVPKHNYRWAIDNVGQLVGLSTRSGKDSDEYYQDVDYVNDREADFEMLQLLKTKGTQKLPPMPIKGTMSEKEYKEAFAKWQKDYNEVKAKNLQLDNEILNRDFMKVMEDFIYNATIFNAKQATKPMLYLLIEDLANNGAYAIKGLWNRRLIKDAKSSTSDDIQFQRTSQKNTIEMVKNLARRILFDQYHNNTPLRKTMNFYQNIASAKFMVFNLYGGIANIATGKVNIQMEEFANKYFGFKEFHEAERQYLGSSVNLIRDFFSENAHNITGALIKKFNVVDFDEILQFSAGGKSMDESFKKMRNFLYSFQSVGEHYMQNSVLLAMLKSNRLYKDDKGVTRIGDFKDFSWEIEKNAMRIVAEKYPEIKQYYETYLANIRFDKETLMEINMGTKDINANFLRGLIRNSNFSKISSMYEKLAKEYKETRKKLIDEAKKEFLKYKTVESLFEFKDGKAVLKEEEIANFDTTNPIGNLEELIAQFREKVISVNQHIHGVYDKKGAALIEGKWYGSVLMQYKKHLPMGILKHWRRRGYYSEFRGSMERGMYQSIIDFLGMEFQDFGKRVKNKVTDENNPTNACLASLQVAMESILNTVHYLKTNYNLLPQWQIDNMRRILAEMTAILLCMGIVAALYAGWDDDEVKNNGWRASLLYLADRLYSETSMYSPLGMSSEWKTTYNSPVAAASGPNDMFKLMKYTTQYLFDPEFDVNYKTGQYAHRNKFGVILRRNIPGVRPYDQINFITKKTQYYKLDKSQIGIHAAKNFGEYLHEE